MVVLDNNTSEVLAMVGGQDAQYNRRPFNLATQGQRQPGSSFKPFILAQALKEGISPNATFTSRKKEFCVTKSKNGSCTEAFVVNNYDDAYSGVTSLANATAFSDNSVYAELGIKVGTRKIARLAHKLGVRTPISSNFAMTLGGLKEGVNVLDMAHAYESFAQGGKLIYGTLSPGAGEFMRNDEEGTAPGPVGIKRIDDPDGHSARLLNGKKAINKTHEQRILDDGVAANVESLLQGVVRIGSGKRAAVGGIAVAGKTGTTENYGDAWFVGWSPEYTVAVWVGYPDEVKPMEPPTFSFNGEPVAGGTYPAAICATFMHAALAIHPPKGEDADDTDAPTTTATTVPGHHRPGAHDGAEHGHHGRHRADRARAGHRDGHVTAARHGHDAADDAVHRDRDGPGRRDRPDDALASAPSERLEPLERLARLVARGVVAAVEGQEQLEVVAEVADQRARLRRASHHCPVRWPRRQAR